MTNVLFLSKSLSEAALQLATATAALVEGGGDNPRLVVQTIAVHQNQVTRYLAEAGRLNDAHFVAGGKVDRAPVSIDCVLRALSAIGAAAASLVQIAVHGIDQVHARSVGAEERLAALEARLGTAPEPSPEVRTIEQTLVNFDVLFDQVEKMCTEVKEIAVDAARRAINREISDMHKDR